MSILTTVVITPVVRITYQKDWVSARSATHILFGRPAWCAPKYQLGVSTSEYEHLPKQDRSLDISHVLYIQDGEISQALRSGLS